MFKIKIKDSEYTIPNETIKGFALMQALDRGIVCGDIGDTETAVNYLKSIGYEVSSL